MTHLDLFSGIGCIAIAMQEAGFHTVAFAEIEPFPCRVLAHHWPDTPNLGDVSKINGADVVAQFGAIDVVTFGAPCQDLSIAGTRSGLAGARSGLFFEAVRIVAECRATFAVYENVPGLFSSNNGHDFAAVLDALADIGALDIGWRVLDALLTGVPQRRRRIFLVADFGGTRAGEILSLADRLPGYPAARGEAGEGIATGAASGVDGGGRVAGTLGANHGNIKAEHAWTDQLVARPLAAGHPRSSGYRNDADTADNLIVGAICPTLRSGGNATGGDRPPGTDVDTADSLIVDQCHGSNVGPMGTLRAGNGNTAGGVPFVARALTTGSGGGRYDKQPHVVVSAPTPPLTVDAQMHVAFNLRGRDGGSQPEICDAVSLRAASGGSSRSYVAYGPKAGPLDTDGHSQAVHGHGAGVRRLTPTECERLMDVPDGHTNIPGAADGPRYRGLGNGAVVRVVRGIAERMAAQLTEARAL